MVAILDESSEDIPCAGKSPLHQATLMWTRSNNLNDAFCGSPVTSANWRSTISITVSGALDGVNDGLQTREFKIIERHFSTVEDEESVMYYQNELGSVDVRISYFYIMTISISLYLCIFILDKVSHGGIRVKY